MWTCPPRLLTSEASGRVAIVVVAALREDVGAHHLYQFGRRLFLERDDMVYAGKAASTRIRSSRLLTGRPAPFSLRTPASELTPTMSTSPNPLPG